jgi:hypothetical protein
MARYGEMEFEICKLGFVGDLESGIWDLLQVIGLRLATMVSFEEPFRANL